MPLRRDEREFAVGCLAFIVQADCAPCEGQSGAGPVLLEMVVLLVRHSILGWDTSFVGV